MSWWWISESQADAPAKPSGEAPRPEVGAQDLHELFGSVMAIRHEPNLIDPSRSEATADERSGQTDVADLLVADDVGHDITHRPALAQ